MSSVDVRNIRKSYGPAIAVNDVEFFVGEGEFVSLLGPSGCGKTTTLRMIAGLVQPDQGSIILDGRDVVRLPPYKRNLGMVFQSYALFPHMTVAENIAFGLKMKGASPGDTQIKVREALDKVRLPHVADRYPRQLSGGQQQRIALARAIAFGPAVLLLDEPLSNLDLKLRMEMRVELKQLQRDLGITTVFVTHDQGEGLTMSDKVVVMNAGVIAQAGSPREIYEAPASRFVAEFIGEASLLDGEVTAKQGRDVVVKTKGGASISALSDADLRPGQRVTISVRPETVRIGSPNDAREGDNVIQGRLEHTAYGGAASRCIVRINGSEVISADVPEAAQTLGETVAVFWPRKTTNLLAV